MLQIFFSLHNGMFLVMDWVKSGLKQKPNVPFEL